MYKTCAVKLADKLKEAQKEIENLKNDKIIQENAHQAKLQELDRSRLKNERIIKNLNKKLLKAIIAIKQTLLKKAEK